MQNRYLLQVQSFQLDQRLLLVFISTKGMGKGLN